MKPKNGKPGSGPTALVPLPSALPRVPSTLEDYVPRFLGWFALVRHRAPNTVTNYRRDLDRFMEFCALGGITTPNRVTFREIELYMPWLEANRGVGSRTVNRHINALRGFFRYLEREEVVPRNPAALVDTLPQPKRLPNYLTIEVQEMALRILIIDRSLIGRRDYVLIATLLFTGLRCEEIATLRLEHVNLETGKLRVVNGKGGKERELPIIPWLRDTLREYVTGVRPSLLQLGYSRDTLAYVATHGPVTVQAVAKTLGKYQELSDLCRRGLLERHETSVPQTRAQEAVEAVRKLKTDRARVMMVQVADILGVPRRTGIDWVNNAIREAWLVNREPRSGGVGGGPANLDLGEPIPDGTDPPGITYTLTPTGARVLAEGHSSPYVFVNASGTSPHRPDQPLTTKAIWRLVHNKLTPLVGRPVFPHMLRHSFASRLRANGAPLELIAEALGHEQLSTSLIYAHIATPQRNAELARYLAKE